MASAASTGIGAPTLAETAIVLHARIGPLSKALLARFLDELESTCITFGDRHSPLALAAFERYGKG